MTRLGERLVVQQTLVPHEWPLVRFQPVVADSGFHFEGNLRRHGRFHAIDNDWDYRFLFVAMQIENDFIVNSQ